MFQWINFLILKKVCNIYLYLKSTATIDEKRSDGYHGKGKNDKDTCLFELEEGMTPQNSDNMGMGRLFRNIKTKRI